MIFYSLSINYCNGFNLCEWQPTPVLLPGKSHGRRGLVGCSPWSRQESDTTERRHFHFSLSCIGEGNGNPLQCSCQENPRDRGAWWAAVSGVAQSRTRLKRLSSSSSSSSNMHRRLHQIIAEYTFLSSDYRTFSKIHHILNQKINLRILYICNHIEFLLPP